MKIRKYIAIPIIMAGTLLMAVGVLICHGSTKGELVLDKLSKAIKA